MSLSPRPKLSASSQSSDQQRRRLLYQSSYTSCKETDIMLAAFARACLADMDQGGLASYEALLALGDDTIWRIVAKGETPPPDLDRTALDALLNFMRNRVSLP